MTPNDAAVLAACRAHAPQFDRMDPTIQKYALVQMQDAISAYLSSIGGVVCSIEPVEHQRLVPSFSWQRVDDEDLPHYSAKGMPRRTLHTPIPEAGNGGDGKAFAIGDRVRKTKGSSWQGNVVGFYSTELTPIGYCVESEREPGSVQIYPETALEAISSHEGREKA